MELLRWKTELPDVFNRLCTAIHVNDTAIDWIDIIFEQIGGASKCPPHSHTWFEFNYVLAGHLQTRFNDELVTIREDEFFLIPPGLTHAHTYTRGNPHEGICLRWRIRKLEGQTPSDSFYERLEALKYWKPGSYRDLYALKPLLFHFFHEASVRRSHFSLQLLLVQFLELLTSIRERDGAISSEGTIAADPLIRKIEVYLEDMQGERLNVDDLAASLHMSYGHLSRLYKQRTGLTIVERMNQIRLEKACGLLRQPVLLIKEVAEQAGFPDICYFSKVFKKKYGLGPLAYRKQVRDKPIKSDRM